MIPERTFNYPIRLDQLEFESAQAAASSTKLSSNQTIFIKNLLADIAQERITLPVDPAMPTAYGYASEYLRGQITILQHILALADQHNA